MNLKYTTSFTKMTEELTYKVYNKTRLVVRGDRSKYGRIISNLGGRWYGKLKGGPGWTISRDKESEIKKLMGVVQEDESLDNMKTSAKSRKNQKKYHRAVSEKESDEESPEEDKESSDESSDEDEEVIKHKVAKKINNEHRKEVSNKHRRKINNNKPRKKNKKSYQERKDILTYYKSFAHSPEQRRYIETDTSSDEDTSSDDSLDYAQSPIKVNEREKYDKLAQEMRNIQRRLLEVELNQRKKKKKRNL
jgi:hypothetical protein